MRLACRIFAWSLAAAIIVLSVVPPSIRPTTQASHGLEHFAIFLITGVAFAAAYPNRLKTLLGLLILFCAAIELVQIWVPGRHARMTDFIVDALGSCFGLGLIYAGHRLRDASSLGPRS